MKIKTNESLQCKCLPISSYITMVSTLSWMDGWMDVCVWKNKQCTYILIAKTFCKHILFFPLCWTWPRSSFFNYLSKIDRLTWCRLYSQNFLPYTHNPPHTLAHTHIQVQSLLLFPVFHINMTSMTLLLSRHCTEMIIPRSDFVARHYEFASKEN